MELCKFNGGILLEYGIIGL